MQVYHESHAAPAIIIVERCDKQSIDVYREGSAIRFTGEINAGSVACFLDLASREVDQLIITSHGGSSDSGIQMAEEVYRRSIDVVVRDYCLSACASFVFIAGKKRRLEPGAVIGFHKTSSSYSLIARNLGLDNLVTRLRNRAEREQELYRRVGVSPDLLLAPEANIRPICIAESGDDAMNRAELRSQANFWYPDSASMEAFGLHIDKTNWHETREDLASRLTMINRRFGASFSFGQSYDRDQVQEILNAVQICNPR